MGDCLRYVKLVVAGPRMERCLTLDSLPITSAVVFGRYSWDMSVYSAF
ncbi:MAG: hypothetical protein OJF51_003772 [Nitrospira sp.]|jgi:hypothetical protein|nr:MAG: hypothetical protein OJF51_003772 [Nitrospira sp.]